MTTRHLITRASGFMPIALSIAALGVVAVGLLTGATRQADEGALARAWQILMAGQVPIVAWFAVRWLALAPRPGIVVLAAQAAAAIAALAPVLLLKL